jgi:hypothetical protein
LMRKYHLEYYGIKKALLFRRAFYRAENNFIEPAGVL